MLHVAGSIVFANAPTSNDIMYSMTSLIICLFKMSFHPHIMTLCVVIWLCYATSISDCIMHIVVYQFIWWFVHFPFNLYMP